MKYRITAFSIHILLSALIFFGCYIVIRYIWYPSIFFFTDGGIDGIKLIAGIDFIIGPVLTFLVYVPGKKGLKLDLTIIALLQTACLSVGLYLVEREKPLALIIADGIASSINLERMRVSNISLEGLKQVNGDYPKLIILGVEPTNENISRLRLESLKGRKIHARSELYVDLRKNLSYLDGQAYSPQTALEKNKEMSKQLQEAINKKDLNSNNKKIWLLPYFSKDGLIYLIIQTLPTFELDYLDIPPNLDTSARSTK